MAKYIASRRSGQLRRQLLPLERLLNLVSVVIYPWLINCQVPSRQPGRRRAQPRVGGAAPRQRRRRRFKRLLVIYEAKPISPAPRPWSADEDRRRAARNNETRAGCGAHPGAVGRLGSWSCGPVVAGIARYYQVERRRHGNLG